MDLQQLAAVQSLTGQNNPLQQMGGLLQLVQALQGMDLQRQGADLQEREFQQRGDVFNFQKEQAGIGNRMDASRLWLADKQRQQQDRNFGLQEQEFAHRKAYGQAAMANQDNDNQMRARQLDLLEGNNRMDGLMQLAQMAQLTNQQGLMMQVMPMIAEGLGIPMNQPQQQQVDPRQEHLMKINGGNAQQFIPTKLHPF